MMMTDLQFIFLHLIFQGPNIFGGNIVLIFVGEQCIAIALENLEGRKILKKDLSQI